MLLKPMLRRCCQALTVLFCSSSAHSMITGSLVVNDTTGVELAYIDTGAPPASSYLTIFAVHGMIFTNGIFEKIMDVAASKGVRFVAVQRRPFPGSTPFTPEEFNLTMTGSTSEAERVAYIEARGHELASFVDRFVTKFKTPPIDANGNGGAVLWGWSVGGFLPVAAVGSATTLPEEVKSNLAAHVRSLIVYESAPLVFGLPTPTQNWTPLADTTLPQEARLPAFGQWCTGYFDQGNITLSTPHDHARLQWILSTPEFVPTFYNIPREKLDAITTYGEDASTDVPVLSHFPKELNGVYRKAFNDAEVAKIFPKMKRSFLTGDRTAAFAIAGLWAVQDDQAQNGSGTPVEYKIVSGGNHFLHWDHPEKALKAVLDLA